MNRFQETEQTEDAADIVIKHLYTDGWMGNSPMRLFIQYHLEPFFSLSPPSDTWYMSALTNNETIGK